uniref:DNA mismatch repair proteins mutS family domain-containing protein n=1 Tax=Kwoniella pini CBS 10737 TaxID=1296096 RepID=A0A1B9I2S1_9TREE|nr:uncharacterized protein I206_04341 [Kwoniella pini CBS 10737]OCF49814.1 hypothetical protein I206_04341 [Kwoniella pini CBS 10737]
MADFKVGAGEELGIAAHSLKTGHFADTTCKGASHAVSADADYSAFHKTIQHLTMYTPCSIIIPDGKRVNGETLASSTRLIDRLQDTFELTCETVPRDYWVKDLGAEYIKKLGVPGEARTSTLLAISDKYFALCATSALFKHLEHEDLHYSRETLPIRYATSEGTMFIDTDTVKNLELVANSLTHKMTGTLYGVLNRCFTPMGSRLLRSNILQPCNVRDTILTRLDAVTELVSSPERLRDIRDRMGKLANATRTGTHARIENVTDFRISILLQLEKFVQAVRNLTAELNHGKSKMMKEIHDELADPVLSMIQSEIQKYLNTDGTAANPKKKVSSTARLYAVKSECNQLLDIARKTYRENLDDIEQCEHDVDTANLTIYVEQYGISSRLEPVASKFRFCINSQDLEGGRLPSECINLDRKKSGKIAFTTHELLQRNAKLEQAQQEVLSLSEEIVAALLTSVMGDISGLYSCSIAIAKLDVLAGFAEIASPEDLAYSLTTQVRAGRHPILDRTLDTDECVPNDIYVVRGHASFQLIQGPNMSGKSTFLRQVGLLTVQAMLGCYVPARYANFILPDALLSRLSNDGKYRLSETGADYYACRFAREESTTGLATPKSLVLVDELGRGTAPLEGLGLAQAIAECLIERKVFVFFTTHFHDLATTFGALPGVVKMHLRVEDNRVGDNNEAFSSHFQYKVEEGPAILEHYGLELAKLAFLPSKVMSRAKEVATRLSDLDKEGRNSTASHALVKRRKVLFELRDKLVYLLKNSHGDNTALAATLRNLQEDTIDELRKTFKE